MNTSSISEIESLVKQAVDENTDAFGELYVVFAQKIYRYVYYNIHDRTAAEDITQEVFIKAWKAIKTCRGKEATFSAWLYRIAHNLLIDKYRKLRKDIFLEEQTIEYLADSGERAYAGLEQQDLIDSLDVLSSDQRQLIILKFIEGMDNREIAGIMNKSEGAVRIMQMRALTTLRKRIRK